MSNEYSIKITQLTWSELKSFAKKEEISMNQFIAAAVAEKMSAVKTYDYLQERSGKGSLKHFRGILNKIPDRPPGNADKI